MRRAELTRLLDNAHRARGMPEHVVQEIARIREASRAQLRALGLAVSGWTGAGHRVRFTGRTFEAREGVPIHESEVVETWRDPDPERRARLRCVKAAWEREAELTPDADRGRKSRLANPHGRPPGIADAEIVATVKRHLDRGLSQAEALAEADEELAILSIPVTHEDYHKRLHGRWRRALKNLGRS